MKKIVINGRFLLHRVTGVERYAREILHELDRIIEPGSIIMAVPPGVEETPHYKNIKLIRVGRLQNRLWEHISFPVYVSKNRGVSLNLCNTAPILSPGIVCIHDVKVKAKPQYFSKKFLLWYGILFGNAAKRAKAIITVSEFSKSEIVKYYQIDPDRIHVIPSSWQHVADIRYDENALHKYGLKKDAYYLSMNSLEPNKNLKWIAEAARKTPDQVFAVAGSVNETVFSDGIGFQRPANMKFLGYITDEEAKTLMRDCKAFLFPTFYEGFGLPPMEALGAGCRKIIVSDTAVMHELYKDSANYIDPVKCRCDFTAIKEAGEVNEILNKYTWKNNACLLYNLLKDYIGSS